MDNSLRSLWHNFVYLMQSFTTCEADWLRPSMRTTGMMTGSVCHIVKALRPGFVSIHITHSIGLHYVFSFDQFTAQVEQFESGKYCKERSNAVIVVIFVSIVFPEHQKQDRYGYACQSREDDIFCF